MWVWACTAATQWRVDSSGFPRRAMEAAQVAGDASNSIAATGRAGWSGRPVVAFGEVVAVADGENTNTPGEHSLVGRGVKEDYLVGMTGFEPATLRSQSECATKLRHIPVPPPGGVRSA